VDPPLDEAAPAVLRVRAQPAVRGGHAPDHQTNPVIVYRLIHSSCVEKKVYQKQVFKEGLRVISEKGNEIGDNETFGTYNSSCP
jgi:hypothetical protein